MIINNEKLNLDRLEYSEIQIKTYPQTCPDLYLHLKLQGVSDEFDIVFVKN